MSLKERYLKNFALFFSVNEKTIKEIAHFCEVSKYKKDEIIFLEDEKLKYLYGVISGNVITYSVDSKGDIIPKSNFFEGDLLGLISNIQNENSFLNAKTLTESLILKIEFDKFKKYLSYPPFSDRVIKFLSNSIKTQTKLSRLDELNSTQKLAYVLINFPPRFIKKKKYLLAKELKMSPETLSRVIRKFKNEGLIDDKNGEIILLNRETLKNYL